MRHPTDWDPDHPELRASWLTGLRPAVAAALDDPGRLAPLCAPLGPGVYRLELLAPDVCAALCQDLARYEAWSERRGDPPNSMHRYGVALGELGYGPAVAQLLDRLLRPLAPALFPELPLPTQAYGFSVAYGEDKDQSLGFHADDADLTFNLCLGEPGHAGAELYFRGVRCPRHRQQDPRAEERFEIEHEPGVAILHAGAHRHGVHPIHAGVRRNVIFWCQADHDRDDLGAPCPAWCDAR